MKTQQQPISPATHAWRGSDWRLLPCFQCKKETTGRIKGVSVKFKERSLCSSCASAKGFK